MRISGKALRQVHNAVAPHVVAGASTMDLEEIAIAKIAELGAISCLQGLSRLSRRPLHLGQRRGSSRHPQRQTRPQRRRHPLHRLRRHHRRLLRRRRRHLSPSAGTPPHRPAPRDHPGLTRKGHRAVPGRRPPGRYLRSRPGTVRGRRLRRSPRIRRPRHRPRMHEDPQVPNFGPAAKAPVSRQGWSWPSNHDQRRRP